MVKNQQNNFKLRPEIDDNNTVWYLWELVHNDPRSISGKHWTRTAKYKSIQEAVKYNPNVSATLDFSKKGEMNGLFEV